MTSLVGVKTLQGESVITPPSINTNISFSVSSTNPPTCQSIFSDAASSGNINSFLQKWKLVNSDSDPSLLQHDIKKNLNNFYTSLASSEIDKRQILDLSNTNNSKINTYLNKIQTEQIPILRLVDSCMRESQEPDSNELLKQKESTDESKLRLESVKNPETKVSYYEGWFPLFRPMSETALFGIFITGVFLLILSIGIFLRMNGIQFSITMPTLFISSGVDTTKYMYIGLGVGGIGGLAVYGYTKGWFGSR